MTAPITIGAHVRLPAHAAAGTVVAYAGEAPDRFVTIQLEQDGIMIVGEGELVVDAAEIVPAPPKPSAIC